MLLPRGTGAVFLTCAVAWVITALTHGWAFWIFLILSLLITYFVLGGWYYRNASPWRRIYFPLMDRYSLIAGAHLGIAEESGRVFTPRDPLGALLRQIQPEFNEEETVLLLDNWEHELQNGGDRTLLAEIMREGGVPAQDIPGRLTKIRDAQLSPKNYNGVFVRYAIGQIIEAKAGREQKKSYWKAVMSGKVS